MRHLTPAQRENSKRWDYICEHNDISYPIGYCGGWVHPDKLEKDLGKYPLANGQRERMLEHKDKYHNDGHDTELAACECYQGYLLDFYTRTYDTERQQVKCKICDVWTNRVVYVETRMFHLCPDHANRYAVSGLFDVGKSWES